MTLVMMTAPQTLSWLLLLLLLLLLFNNQINQSINIRLLRHDKTQANTSKQKGCTVSKKKAGIENKPEN